MFRSLRALASLVCLAGAPAFAQTVFTTNTVISDTDLTFDGQDIVIRGCTVTINGAHTFASVTIERSASNAPGVLTHTAAFANAKVQGVFITTTGDFFLQGADGALVASRIDLNARGHAPGTGPGASQAFGCCGNRSGGAGHAGAGGDGSNHPGGPCYDDFDAPAQLGSGSGGSSGAPGAAGGGAIRLVVAGVCTIDGSLTAHGADGSIGSNTSFSGGGSGGSVRIDAATLDGVGSISADGGAGGGVLEAGGGGGGRIALAAASSSFTGAVNACGGPGFMPGGAGTVFTVIATRPELLISNCGQTGATSEMTGETQVFADTIVRDGAIVGPARGATGFHLAIVGDCFIDAGAAIAADLRGHTSAMGPGASTSYGCCGNRTGGAAHAGAGGDGLNHPGGDCYGSLTNPVDLGSGAGSSNGVLGGTGGGALRLTVSGSLDLAGQISANAGPGAAGSNSSYTGGGAGGSIWVQCASLSGDGSISAIGGDAGASTILEGGGGGGGRIALYYDDSTFTGPISAHGGAGYVTGGAGTIFLKPTASRATLIIDNNDQLGEATEFSGERIIDANLIIRNAGLLSHPHQHEGLHLTFTGDAIVEADGFVGADRRGHPANTGPGTTQAFGCCGVRGGGAAHGGAGSDSINYPGGSCYGSLDQPTELGSGAGNVNNAPGGVGGGAIHLTVLGELVNDGTFSVNAGPGSAGSNNSYSGGGSAGSLWVECGTLAGSGSFQAIGGDAGNPETGAGGGGRISVSFSSSSFAGQYIARGGDGLTRGGAGTVFTKPSADRGTLVIDNADVLGEATEFVGSHSIDANLVVRNAGLLSHPHEQHGLHLTFAGNASIEADGFVAANARGHPANTGPGSTTPLGCCGNRTGGAGHAGAGSDSINHAGGNCYGSFSQPIDLGSGSASSNDARGGAGGGAIRLTILGDLLNDGVFSVNGGVGRTGSNFSATGGGAAGSLWIECDSLSGTGDFQAIGGNAGSPDAGAGGGGRIAIYYTSSSFAGNFLNHGGTGASPGGAGTTYTKPAGQLGTIIIDNNALAGEATEYTGDVAFDAHLVVTNHAVLSHPHNAGPLHLDVTGDVIVHADGVIGVDARGHFAAQGPGASVSLGCCGRHSAGAGHAGPGGNADDNPGGPSYGDPLRPDLMGSGAGNSNNAPGGAGGGALRLFIQGSLLVHGTISAAGGNGALGSNNAVSGGGSGGSLWIKADSISGDGFILAPGGNAASPAAGGGSGGRIALYACPTSLDPAHIAATGGSGFQPGSEGSIVLGSSTITITQQPTPLTYYRDADVIDLSVVASSSQDPPTLTFQWYRNAVALNDGDLDGIIQGATTSTLRINGIGCDDGGVFDVVVTDACGSFPSQPANVFVFARADFNLDGVLNSQDFFDFLNAFFTSDPSSDFNEDNRLNSQDFFDFLAAFFTGCS